MKRTTTAWGLALMCLVVCGMAIGCNDDKPTTTQPAGGGGRATTQPAGGGAGTTKKRGTIGISVLTLTNPFFQEIADSVTAEANKLGFDVVVVSGDQNPAKQHNQVKDFITSGCVAIILTPCDSGGVGEAIREANRAGIPVFTADIASIAKDAKVESHIATDNYGGGKMAAQAIVEALRAKGDARGEIAIIDYDEVESVKQRTDGFIVQLAELNKAADVDLTIVARVPGQGDRLKGLDAMNSILSSNPNVKAVFAINDPCALGAVAALETVGNKSIVIVGFDGQIDGKRAIKAGKIYADPIQFPVEIGKKTVEAFVKFSMGDEVKKQYLIPTALYRQADAEKDPALK